ncbi:uncharacterized protein LOC143359013 [Halictus rubicundus]|uniref:uncharacterized protein LOC143359013 n=1 Tax=Halictus rubicundus TaxID=77578 RepID=UPI004035B8F7
MLELLTRQIAAQEKQFLGLTETVRDLVREKSRLQDTLEQKQMESDAIRINFQRTKELLETERLERSENSAGKVHRACQTEEVEIVTSCKGSSREESNKESVSRGSQNLRIKSKEDLEELSTDGTLLRELFFRKPSIEENGTLDIIPVLSEFQPCAQMKRSSSLLFI